MILKLTNAINKKPIYMQSEHIVEWMATDPDDEDDIGNTIIYQLSTSFGGVAWVDETPEEVCRMMMGDADGTD